MMPYVDHFHTTSKMFDGFQRLDVDMSKVMIILNQVGKGSIYKQRADQIAKRFKRPLVERRKDEALHKMASDRGILLEKASNNRTAMKEFDEICELLKPFMSENEPAYILAQQSRQPASGKGRAN